MLRICHRTPRMKSRSINFAADKESEMIPGRHTESIEADSGLKEARVGLEDFSLRDAQGGRCEPSGPSPSFFRIKR